MRQNKKMAKGGNKSAGFTIVETLIVLAVSALVAISAMLLVAGRQNKTQFTVSTNNLKQQLEQIINETRNGYYPNGQDFQCNGNTAGAKPGIMVGAKSQGTNDSCVFLGKAVQFGVGASQMDPEVFYAYPMVGNRQYNNLGTVSESASYAQANPLLLATTSFGGGSAVDHSQPFRTQNGLTFRKAKYYIGTNQTTITSTVTVSNYAAFAFADDLSGYAVNSSGDLDSATEKLNLYYFGGTPDWGAQAPGAAPNNTSDYMVYRINSRAVNEVANAQLVKVDLCFDGIVANQTATYTITGFGQLSVKLKISSTAC